MKTPNRAEVVEYDHALRFHVPSRRKNVAPYLIELDAFDGNGVCQCEHFTCRLEEFLKEGIPPAVAVDSGLVEIPLWGTVEDALRCYHIHLARLKLADELIAIVITRTP